MKKFLISLYPYTLAFFVFSAALILSPYLMALIIPVSYFVLTIKVQHIPLYFDRMLYLKSVRNNLIIIAVIAILPQLRSPDLFVAITCIGLTFLWFWIILINKIHSAAVSLNNKEDPSMLIPKKGVVIFKLVLLLALTIPSAVTMALAIIGGFVDFQVSLIFYIVFYIMFFIGLVFGFLDCFKLLKIELSKAKKGLKQKVILNT